MIADLQAFLNAGGGDAEGATYNVSAPLTMPTKSKLFNCTINAINIPVALIAGDGVNPLDQVCVRDVTVNNAGVAFRYCGDTIIERVRVVGAPQVGFEINQGYEFRLIDCSAKSGLGTGFLISGGGADQNLTRCRTVGGLIGVDVQQTYAAWFDTVETSFCATGLQIGYGPEICEFLFSTRGAYDQGAGHGIKLGPKARCLRFAQDWSSSNGKCGVLVEGAADIGFHQMRCYNNGWHGMQLTGADFCVTDSTFSGNGGAQPPAYHGICIGYANGVRLIGNRSGQTAHFAALQGYGILVASPYATNITMTGNDCRSNQLGGIMGSHNTGGNIP